MPAYFSLDMEFNRYEVDFDTVKQIEERLERAGLVFRSGYWGKAEQRSREEIILHNQTLLEEDFMLGFEQHHDEGYWQSEYDCEGFSSVRGYFMNNYPIKGEFSFVLLVAEDEVLDWDSEGTPYRKDAIGRLMELAKKLWEMPQIRSIQTGLEGNDSITPESEYREGAPIAAHPFAIISERCFTKQNESLYEAEHIPFGGVLLTDKKARF